MIDSLCSVVFCGCDTTNQQKKQICARHECVVCPVVVCVAGTGCIPHVLSIDCAPLSALHGTATKRCRKRLRSRGQMFTNGRISTLWLFSFFWMGGGGKQYDCLVFLVGPRVVSASVETRYHGTNIRSSAHFELVCVCATTPWTSSCLGCGPFAFVFFTM